MTHAQIDGIATRYRVVGNGPPLLMFSPGGFNARLDNWTDFSVYRRAQPVEHLSRRYTCIMFDRREAGGSGGRVERIAWADYVAQGRGLLDHLGIDRAHLMGGCQGCSPVLAFAVAHPDRVLSMICYWPAGGARYRLATQARFAQHLAFVEQHGLAEIVAAVKTSDTHFGQEPQLGPWASIIRADASFAAEYKERDQAQYSALVAGMARNLVDRDTVAGAEPEDLLQLAVPALIVPGRDRSHATSAARYLEECLPAADYWDVAVADQTEQTVPGRIEAFLDATSAGR